MVDEETLKREIKISQSLHQLNRTLTLENEEYSNALLLLKQRLAEERGEILSNDECVESSEAAALVEEVISTVPKCQCKRWKALFQKESEEVVRLTQLTESLQESLQSREKQSELDKIEYTQLLEAYLKFYNKSLDQLTVRVNPSTKDSCKEGINTETTKKQQQTVRKSKSKGKEQQRQSTPKKKKVEHPFMNKQTQLLQREVIELQSQLKLLRAESIRKEQLFQAYRERERQHLLNEGSIESSWQ